MEVRLPEMAEAKGSECVANPLNEAESISFSVVIVYKCIQQEYAEGDLFNSRDCSVTVRPFLK